MSAVSIGGKVIRGRYQDSVRLMRIGESKRSVAGVEAVGVIMGTPSNIELLTEMSLAFEGIDEATSNDIVLAVRGRTPDIVECTLAELQNALDSSTTDKKAQGYETVRAALADLDVSQVIGFVATPGDYAATEVYRFLNAGYSVFVFSDNVPMEEEIALKEAALAAGKIIMGPDAGTASIGSLRLGFTNEVRRGGVGLVAASGTGAQAVASYLDQLGGGVSHIIGVGGRDLSSEVGGISTSIGLQALLGDDETEVICLVAKEFTSTALLRLLPNLSSSTKPIVAYVQNSDAGPALAAVGVHVAPTLQETARRCLDARNSTSRFDYRPGRTLVGNIRGLFVGGTLASEARNVLHGIYGAADQARPGMPKVSVVDLGGDEYTKGRPHPMIAPSIQADRLSEAIADDSVGAVLFDVVLGSGAHVDPAGVVVKGIIDGLGRREGLLPLIGAVVVGTAADHQGLERSCAALQWAGVEVFSDVAAACIWATGIAQREPHEVQRAGWLEQPEAVVLVGTDWFLGSLEAQDVRPVYVDWRPVAEGDQELASIIGRLG